MPRIDKTKRYHDVFGGDSVLERNQIICELQDADPGVFAAVRLSKTQVKTLSEYMLLLPADDFRLLVMHYCLRQSYARIERELQIQCVRGTIAYLKDRITQCMGITRPIAEPYWGLATNRALDQWTESN